MENLNGWIEIISLISGIASIVIGVLAIWLSITFYKMSVNSSNEVKDSSNKINNNVEKLDKMFNTMYADTFGMVKESVNHMREQVDRNNNGVDMSEEIKGKIEAAISDHLVNLSTENLTKSEVKDLVLELVKESKEIEAVVRKETMKDKVLEVLQTEGANSFKYLESQILGKNSRPAEFKAFFDTVYELKQGGFIDAEFLLHPDMGLTVLNDKPIRLLKNK